MKIDKVGENLDKIYSIFPNTKTELDYSTPFQLVIAVIMSAQTTDKQVNKINSNFFQKIKTPEDVYKLSLQSIENKLTSLNYYKNKSKYIKQTWDKLYLEYNSKIPNDINVLRIFPGIWIKTAKVILWVLYDAPYVAVDTHVHRVTNRIWIVKTKTPEQTDKVLDKILNTEQKKKIHHSLVLFWRYLCRAKKPSCDKCTLNKDCNYFKKIKKSFD